MLDLLFSSYQEKHYFIRDICNGVKYQYEYRSSERLQLSPHQNKRCLDILSIDLNSDKTPSHYSLIDTLDLDISQYKRGRAKAISQAFTFKEYMEFSLYDSKVGYYTTNQGLGRDFQTKPMRHSPHYGMWAGELIFQLWMKMIDDNSLVINEPFHIIEGGAGTGIFARDIINYAASKNTGKDSLRKRFYDNLFYLILEISPELVEKQKKTLFKCDSKYAIYHGDIRHLEKEVTDKLSAKGFFLSNELPDAFSMHKVRRMDNKLQVSIVFPVLKQKLRANQTIVDCDLFIRHFLFPQKSSQPKDYLLSKDLYQRLSKHLSLNEIHKRFDWEELWINGQEIEEIRRFIHTHTPFFGKMVKNREYPLNTDLRHFQKSTSNLIEAGYKVTIDYQENNHTIINAKDSFRCYPGGVKHDFKILPGTYDITADVNASSLAEEGMQVGWKPVFFGTERMLLALGNHETIDQLARVRMNFKVVIEKKGGQEAENSLPIISLPLTYRDLLLNQCDLLPKIFKDVIDKDEFTISMVAHNLYAALLDLKDPVRRKFDRKDHKSLKRINDSISPLSKDLKKAIKLVFKSFLGKNSLLLVAKDYENLSQLELKRMAFVFNRSKTKDSVDYLAFLIIRQVLQMFYYFRHHPPMLPIKLG